MPKKTWNKEKLKRVKHLIEKGVAMETIALDYGVSKQRIHQLAVKHGFIKFTPRVKATSLIKTVEDRTIYRLWTVARPRHYAYGTKHTFIPFSELVPAPTHCPVLGVKLDYSEKIVNGRSEFSPSLDRIDPMKGYTKDNVAVISWRANRIKNDGTTEEHRLIYEFMKNKLNTVDIISKG